MAFECQGQKWAGCNSRNYSSRKCLHISSCLEKKLKRLPLFACRSKLLRSKIALSLVLLLSPVSPHLTKQLFLEAICDDWECNHSFYLRMFQNCSKAVRYMFPAVRSVYRDALTYPCHPTTLREWHGGRWAGRWGLDQQSWPMGLIGAYWSYTSPTTGMGMAFPSLRKCSSPNTCARFSTDKQWLHW